MILCSIPADPSSGQQASDSVIVSRHDWNELVARFTALFQGAGEVTVTDDAVVFSAEGTGLELRRDGSSSSFMPLHEMGARWDEVQFDASEASLRLRGAGVAYTYRMLPQLRRNA